MSWDIVCTMSQDITSAETGGFEPPVGFNPDPSLAVKSIRPLWHVSTMFAGYVDVTDEVTTEQP